MPIEIANATLLSKETMIIMYLYRLLNIIFRILKVQTSNNMTEICLMPNINTFYLSEQALKYIVVDI